MKRNGTFLYKRSAFIWKRIIVAILYSSQNQSDSGTPALVSARYGRLQKIKCVRTTFLWFAFWGVSIGDDSKKGFQWELRVPRNISNRASDASAPPKSQFPLYLRNLRHNLSTEPRDQIKKQCFNQPEQISKGQLTPQSRENSTAHHTRESLADSFSAKSMQNAVVWWFHSIACIPPAPFRLHVRAIHCAFSRWIGHD
jgi:hypothetical protein